VRILNIYDVIKKMKQAGKKRMSKANLDDETDMAKKTYETFHTLANTELDIAALQKAKNSYNEYVTKLTIVHSNIPPYGFQVKEGKLLMTVDPRKWDREIEALELMDLINSLFDFNYLRVAHAFQRVTPRGFNYLAEEDFFFELWQELAPKLVYKLPFLNLIVEARKKLLGQQGQVFANHY